jgi:hypothetical protein
VDSLARLDERVSRAYLAGMTSRLLLTLLALLSGLAVQATPAEVRPQSARATEMSAIAALAGEARKSMPQELAEHPARARHRLLAFVADLPLPGFAPLVSTVLIGIDRFRE